MDEHTPASDPVGLEIDGSIARITLNRPERRNAMNRAAWARLRERVAEVAADSSVRVAIVRGAGPSFCAGADMKAGPMPDHPLRHMRAISDPVRELFELPIPTVAAVQGAAVGAGWNIALACDFVVCADDARFSQIFARRALSVDTGGSWLLPRLVGMQQAKRLLYLAEMISADEALALGLVLRVVPAAELDAEVTAFARRLAAGAPATLRLNKELVNGTWEASLAEQMLRENVAQAVNFATDVPAARAAIERGEEPVFEGKWQL
ncbi:MAG: enoyl-CoA hydratase-related protein [Microbacterium sp.]